VNASSFALLPAVIQQAGGIPGRLLPILDAVAADVPNAALSVLNSNPFVLRVALEEQAFSMRAELSASRSFSRRLYDRLSLKPALESAVDLGQSPDPRWPHRASSERVEFGCAVGGEDHSRRKPGDVGVLNVRRRTAARHQPNAGA
jgi:hypothetical protein